MICFEIKQILVFLTNVHPPHPSLASSNSFKNLNFEKMIGQWKQADKELYEKNEIIIANFSFFSRQMASFCFMALSVCVCLLSFHHYILYVDVNSFMVTCMLMTILLFISLFSSIDYYLILLFLSFSIRIFVWVVLCSLTEKLLKS